MAKRGDRVAPPPKRGEWELRFFTAGSADGWENLCKQAPGPTREAWEIISREPRFVGKHIDDPVGRLGRGVGVQRAEYENAGLGRLQGHLNSFQVAHLARHHT